MKIRALLIPEGGRHYSIEMTLPDWELRARLRGDDLHLQLSLGRKQFLQTPGAGISTDIPFVEPTGALSPRAELTVSWESSACTGNSHRGFDH